MLLTENVVVEHNDFICQLTKQSGHVLPPAMNPYILESNPHPNLICAQFLSPS
jgi:hypothetical protein